MINKKISKILAPIIGIMGFLLAAGVMEIPAFADSDISAQASTTTTQAAVTLGTPENEDYFINVNKSVTQNGVKVTVDKVAASKHKLKVVVKIESDKPIDREKISNSIEEVTYGENDVYGGGEDSNYPDDKTMIITMNRKCDNSEYPEKGDLRVDIVFPEYKVNAGIDVPVDFSEQFKKTIEKEVGAKIEDNNITIDKLECDTLGTYLAYSRKSSDLHGKNEFMTLSHSPMILKVGDKMYETRSTGSSSTRDKDNNRITKGEYEAESLTYDRVKDKGNISVVPIVCNITSDELIKINKNKNEIKDGVSTKDTINNVSYENSFEFNDGTKGEIYNIERNDNSVKVYCKGDSEKESLLMASNMRLSYEYIKGQDKFDYYTDNNQISFYKDPKDNLGYIVEFNNVKKDKAADLNIDNIIKYIDKFKIENEIEILK